MVETRQPASKQAKGRGAKHVYDELKREILTLEIEPGTPLDETTLSNRFAMSRSPVREALVRLSADGLVVMLSNRSTLVAPIDLAGFPQYVEALDFLQRINTRLAARHRREADRLLGHRAPGRIGQHCHEGHEGAEDCELGNGAHQRAAQQNDELAATTRREPADELAQRPECRRSAGVRT
jgi:DNA-binding GntR family transcriptional regulator